MTDFYEKFRIAFVAVTLLAAVSCDDKDESRAVPPPSGPEATPVALTVSSGYYYGQGDALSCDHYTLYLSNGGAVASNDVFSGEGTGVCLQLYAPIQDEAIISSGTYEAHDPIIQSWLYTFEPGSDQGGSYLYLGPDAAPVYIREGALELERSGSSYSISGTVSGSDGKYYALDYRGELSLEERDLPPDWYSDTPDYTQMPRCAGIYFGTMMVDTNDNYSFYLMSEEIIDQGGVFDGAGTAISFDLYAPLNTGVDPAIGVYTVHADTDTSLDFKYKRGEDYGDGMLQGSYIFTRETADDEKGYVYIVGGTLTIETKKGFYRVLIHVQGDDNNTYKFKYIGKSLNILDPFAGM